MTHKKKCFAKIFFVLAVAIVVAPICASLILEFGFKVRTSRVFYQFGIDEELFIPGIFFAASVLYFVTAVLQFPFKEEEGWTCKCGYDLSFLQKKSSHCPECGTKILLEWTQQPGQYSRSTSRRIGWTMLLFLFSGAMLSIGVFLQWVI
jgi:DNA-directed RNA polymerase subunit RPC12/RpoP